MGMRRVLLVWLTVLALCGCHPLPEMRSYELPQHPIEEEHKPLTVPHRDWIAEHCYPLRRQQGEDGRWVEIKRCNIR